MIIFKVENLSINIHNVSLFNPISFVVTSGEVLAIMGPSGCGKSSILNFIAGTLMEPLTGEGNLTLNNVNINSLAAIKRSIGILYQDDLLFPHMSVEQNLLYALSDNTSRSDRKKIIVESLSLSGLDLYLNRMPATLSGGQKSRISLLRTLLSRPKLILLDEPFSKLDKNLRTNFREYVFAEIKKQGIPCIIVTHDIEDVPSEAKIIKILPTLAS